MESNAADQYEIQPPGSPLPLELLMVVFRFLDPGSLKNMALVCKTWYRLSKDNSMWMQIFKERFSSIGSVFPRVSRTRLWRTELIERETLIKNWKKGKGVHNTYNLESLFYTTDLQCDFKTNRLISLNKNTGNLVTCSLNNGANIDLQPSTIPSGTTAYAMSKHSIVFGRWDSKVFGSLINHKNILLSGIKEFKGAGHRGMVTCVNVNQTELGKEGKIGAITGDENGTIVGWDLKKGAQVAHCKICEATIAKVDSDYKDVIVVLDTQGALYVVKNMFNVFDCTPEVHELQVSLEINPQNVMFMKMYVDYGDSNIVLIDENTVEIISYRDNLVRRFVTEEPIYKSSLEQNSTAFTKRDVELVGTDPLFLAILLKSGRVLVINVRAYEYQIRPVLDILPRLAYEDDDYQRVVAINQNVDLPALSEIAINSLVVAVGSYNGKIEFYDITTGEFFRKIAIKSSSKMLQQVGSQLLPITNIVMDQSLSAGVVAYGSMVQFFKFGDFYKELETKRKKKNFKERKYSNNHIKEAIKDYEYELHEEAQTASRLQKYNGDHLEDSDEELQMALALSMSINETSVGSQEQDDDLLVAIELSKQII
ncbi:hypothetical protein KL918_004783 [Ogataea parapolymorpha]|uniref:F-box/WD repeat-containing protein pof10 n=1 Tax=Ogataea parapolymorpha (strain ATCC 26012 / BCRC 20466 / JCM 22074 / NRRL Y-7560 / DL-1) TaxID=871575 RepID=W1QIZ2_OGAPD|nr:F-box/WD repeat-containing protein pof10 [Ogataea parapolymorpha DL-1]ESX01812.1 F-box/WD repeat-containing protein pof10 [Ogataea parapolymorpha DL-1]KAG7865201.1 hypothetical protein KL918_004783 [Ogataea parapolymorpha]KAG7872786.1 hypothetical protein KL916_002831 [Ogataea parapolymorpha]